MSTLGLDIGTSGCKAVVFDADGRQIAEAFREYSTLMPQEGWAELESRRVMDSCVSVIAATAGACARTDPVRAIGISSQGEAFTPVSPGGEIMGNAMVSFDTRAAGLASAWSATFGRERLYELTGHTPHPMFTLFKLLWLRENRPDIWKTAGRFLCFEDLMHLGLGLEPAISHPLAGRTMLFNVCTHAWDPAILSAAGLAPDRLARTLPAGAVVGAVPAARAGELGLGRDVVVVAGGHDQPCGALGAGVLSPGKAMYGMGTVECICPAFETPVFSESLFRSNLCTYDYTIPGMYTTVAFCLTGGNLLRWFRDEWAAEEVRQARETGGNAYERILESMPERPTDLLVLPHFTPTGTPHFDAEATGAILGLRLSTKRREVLRALLEGVTFEMKLNVDILEKSGVRIREFIAIGGGARSRRVCQLKADVLNRPITRAAVTEAGCLGVAMLAQAAVTGERLDGIVRRWVRTQDVLDPNPQRAGFYEERFRTYQELYPLVRGLRKKTGERS